MARALTMATIQEYPDELDYVNAKLRVSDRLESFLTAFLYACLRADGENYELIRPALLALRGKYPAHPALLAAEHRDRGFAPPEGA